MRVVGPSVLSAFARFTITREHGDGGWTDEGGEVFVQTRRLRR